MSCPAYVKRYAESEGYVVRTEGGSHRLRNDRTGTVWPVSHQTRQGAWDSFERTLRQSMAGDAISWLRVTRFDPNRRLARAGHFEVARLPDGHGWENGMTGDASDVAFTSDDAAWEAAAQEAAVFAMDRGGIGEGEWAAMTNDMRVEAVSDAYDRSLNMRP